MAPTRPKTKDANQKARHTRQDKSTANASTKPRAPDKRRFHDGARGKTRSRTLTGAPDRKQRLRHAGRTRPARQDHNNNNPEQSRRRLASAAPQSVGGDTI